jgi:hypothetical protein
MSDKPKPLFVGEIVKCSDRDYGLVIDGNSQELFNQFCRDRSGKRKVRISVSGLTEKKMRSVEQNAYYWGVVIKILADDLGYVGPGEREDLHNELRGMFLVKVGKLGKRVVESTTRLDTETFERYLAAIRGWADEFQNIKIPLPNEVEESDTYTRI